MDAEIKLTLLAVGAVVQVGLMVPNEHKALRNAVIYSLGFAILTFATAMLEGRVHGGWISSVLGYHLLVFPVACHYLFKKQILPKVDELHLVVMTAVFWYAALSWWGPNPLLWLMLIPTLAVIYEAFSANAVEGRKRSWYCVWFLLLALVLGLMLFFQEFFGIIFETGQTLPPFFELILAGMAMVYLAVIGWQLFGISPLLFRTRFNRNHFDNEGFDEELDFLAQKYDAQLQLSRAHAILVLSALTFVLGSNYFLHIVPTESLVGAVIVGMTLWNRRAMGFQDHVPASGTTA